MFELTPVTLNEEEKMMALDEKDHSKKKYKELKSDYCSLRSKAKN